MKFKFIFVLIILFVIGCSEGNKISKPDVISPPTKQLDAAGSGKADAKMIP